MVRYADDAQTRVRLVEGYEMLLVAVLAEADEEDTIGWLGHGIWPQIGEFFRGRDSPHDHKIFPLICFWLRYNLLGL